MKTKNILTAGFAVLLAVIFTSCSTSVEIAKRHFNNGYYVHIASKKNVTAPVKEDLVAKNDVQVVAADVKAESLIAEQPVVVNSATVENVSAVKTVPGIKRTVAEVQKQQGESLPVVTETNSHISQVSDYNTAIEKPNRKGLFSFMRGDAPAIVLILLCIFLPPLAVGIVDDWGSKFWFDILLTLLFYFPGMIYAFFVCFG